MYLNVYSLPNTSRHFTSVSTKLFNHVITHHSTCRHCSRPEFPSASHRCRWSHYELDVDRCGYESACHLLSCIGFPSLPTDIRSHSRGTTGPTHRSLKTIFSCQMTFSFPFPPKVVMMNLVDLDFYMIAFEKFSYSKKYSVLIMQDTSNLRVILSETWKIS